MTVAGLDKSTVSRVVRRVTVAIARRLDENIASHNIASHLIQVYTRVGLHVCFANCT